MKALAAFFCLSALAASAPLWPRARENAPPSSVASDEAWPVELVSPGWQSVALGERERRFARDFPGRLAVFATADDRTRLQTWIAARVQTSDTPALASTPLWIVYIGHGTHDTRETRLNLRGPDVTAKELAAWLAPLTRPLIFIHGGSAGAPFINALSGPDRIIVSATRSGSELNYARFGERFADAVANPAADIDQDGQTSLLEAFVTAAQQVQSFYAETGRLATEHALIDDNGDKQGTPAEWFRGTRVQRRPQDSTAQPDGQHARLLALIPTEAERALTPAQREQRDALERELEVLRAKKPSLPEDDYYRQLESLFRRLGALYRRDS